MNNYYCLKLRHTSKTNLKSGNGSELQIPELLLNHHDLLVASQPSFGGY